MAIVTHGYWSGRGEEQAKYEEMDNDQSFEFSKTARELFYRYYRYFNDGDLPGWARGKREYTVCKRYSGWSQMELNEAGQQELERRVSERIRAEYKRYEKHLAKAN